MNITELAREDVPFDFDWLLAEEVLGITEDE